MRVIENGGILLQLNSSLIHFTKDDHMKRILYFMSPLLFVLNILATSTDELHKCSNQSSRQFYARIAYAKDLIINAPFKSEEDWLKCRESIKANGFIGSIESPSGMLFNLRTAQHITFSSGLKNK